MVLQHRPGGFFDLQERGSWCRGPRGAPSRLGCRHCRLRRLPGHVDDGEFLQPPAVVAEGSLVGLQLGFDNVADLVGRDAVCPSSSRSGTHGGWLTIRYYRRRPRRTGSGRAVCRERGAFYIFGGGLDRLPSRRSPRLSRHCALAPFWQGLPLRRVRRSLGLLLGDPHGLLRGRWSDMWAYQMSRVRMAANSVIASRKP